MVTRLTQCICANGTFCSYKREQCSVTILCWLVVWKVKQMILTRLRTLNGLVTRLAQCIHAKGTFCSYRREQCSVTICWLDVWKVKQMM